MRAGLRTRGGKDKLCQLMACDIKVQAGCCAYENRQQCRLEHASVHDSGESMRGKTDTFFNHKLWW